MHDRDLDPASLVHLYYELIDDGRVEEMLSLFGAEIVYIRGGTPPINGMRALREFYTSGRIIARGRHSLLTVLTDGVWVAVRGTFDGVLKSSEPVIVSFADFFLVTDGLISQRFTYFAERAV